MQTCWNRHQNTLGYVDKCKYKNPPSTNIKGAKSIGGASAYITKYLSKGNDGRRKIAGRLWGCDTETEKLTNVIFTDEEAHEIDNYITRAAIMEIKQEYFTTYIIDIYRSKELLKLLVLSLLKKLAT